MQSGWPEPCYFDKSMQKHSLGDIPVTMLMRPKWKVSRVNAKVIDGSTCRKL
jgi:hypothetical protein